MKNPLMTFSSVTLLGMTIWCASAVAQPVDGETIPTPRMANGQIYLGLSPGQKGFWGSSGRIFGTRGRSHATNLEADEIPFQPWARSLWEYRQANNEKDDPHARCLPAGVVRLIQTVNGFQVLQHPELNRVYMVFGGGVHTWRVIHTDGRPLVDIDDPDTIPTYMGYSTGHWEGDTLVV